MPKKSFFVIILIALVCAGCQQAYSDEPNHPLETDPPAVIDPEDTSSPSKEDDVKVDSDTSKDYPVKDSDAGNDSDGSKQENEPGSNSTDLNDENPNNDPLYGKDDLSVDDNENASSESHDSKDDSQPNEQHEDDTTPGSNTYQLMNVSINQPISSVHAAFGEPFTTYLMQGPSGQWTVQEYDGFSIGINEYSRVEFIEIYAESVDAKLGGSVGIGSSTDNVITELGIPTTQSSYVLNYRKQNVTLKFDLDPVSESVVSIKLFTEK